MTAKTEAEKIRDEAAEAYSMENNTGDPIDLSFKAFVDGADWALRSDPRLLALVKALEDISENNCSYCKECVACGSQNEPLARAALAAWRDNGK